MTWRLRIAGPGLALLVSVIALRAIPDEPILELLLVKSKPEADALLAKIKGGESFELLASRYSIDATAPDGGYLGPIKAEYLLPELREALKRVGEDGLGDVFPTSNGFMILKLLGYPREAAPAKPAPTQLVAYVAGFEEALSYFSRMSKPANYHQDLQAICDIKKRGVEVGLQEMEAQLASGGNPSQLLQAHHTIAQLSAYQGDMNKAIRHFEEAFQIASQNGMSALVLALREKLGIAYLRKGELENCVSNHNARSCIFPLSPEARHKLQAGSRKAAALFTEYLRERPDDLEVKWLLNLALMTLGPPPRDLPASYLLRQEILKPAARGAEFLDIAHSAGLHHMNNAGGSILEDFDNDGRLDLVVSVVDACEPMSFYHGNGDGTFSDRTSQSGLKEQFGGINANQTDYNNDGWMDILVMRGGWEFPMRKSLLKNNGNGTFSDVTAKAGLALPANRTPTAAWADYDNDGWVDLFVGNENAAGQLFRNNGDGTFSDVAAKVGVSQVAFTKGAAWGDYDNDGYPDLYVSNYGQPNFLYHNNRDGTFTEVARALGVEKPIFSFPTWFFDYDNDGCQDLFVSSYVQSVAEIVAEYMKLPPHAETIRLYRNNCHGGFDDVTRQTGLDRVSMAMGANFGDIDNDGFLDFYLGTGSPSYGALVPNLLFQNQNGKRFLDVTNATGTGHLQKGHGIAFGDVDGDGHQDIFLHVGGAIPGDTYGNVLFRNPGNANHWLRVKLVGRKTNRAAIGARIKAVIAEPDRQPRAIYRVVSSGGSFGASSFQQHIGIGKADRVKTLEIWWPTSGTRQTFQGIKANQAIEIVEMQDSYKKIGQ